MRRAERSRVGRWLLAAAIALALGCDDDSSKPSVAEFQKAKEEAVEQAKLAKKARAKRKKLKEVKEAAKPARREVAAAVGSGVLLDSGYSYDPTGKRDPFRSFILDRPDRMAHLETAGPLEQFDLNQLEVVGVVWRTGNARALIQDPSGESYIVGEGAAIGKNQGRVIAIDDDTVVVKEIYVDYLGQETTKDIEMLIRRSEGG